MSDFSDQYFLDQLPKGFYITFAGNIGEGQDIETIIDTAENLKELSYIHWLVIGYGSKYNWLKENVKLRNLHENVHVLGRRPLETMPLYFKFSDVLLASLKKKNIYALTLPGKIQAYMASAKPIIAMIDGETARIIEESGSGLAVPSEDVEGLTDAVKLMSQMTINNLESMGNNGKRYYLENFDFKKSLEKLDQFIKHKSYPDVIILQHKKSTFPNSNQKLIQDVNYTNKKPKNIIKWRIHICEILF